MLTQTMRAALGRVLVVACRMAGVVPEEEARRRVAEARAAVEAALGAANATLQQRIEFMRQELDAARPQRVDESVRHIACPRCNALAGSACVDPDGRQLKRTHPERTRAWREIAVQPRPAQDAPAQPADPTPDEVLDGMPGDTVGGESA